MSAVIALMAIGSVADRRLVRLGAQNCHWEPSGPFTGEISPLMLTGLVEYVLIGHSERRRAGETDEQTARKVAAVAANAMTPILFVGEDDPTAAAAEETEERLERGLTHVDVARRARAGLLTRRQRVRFSRCANRGIAWGGATNPQRSRVYVP